VGVSLVRWNYIRKVGVETFGKDEGCKPLVRGKEHP